MAVRRIRAERSPNRAAHLRQEHNTLLARMPPDTMRTGLARAAARGIQACGQTVAHFFGTDHARSRGTRALPLGVYVTLPLGLFVALPLGLALLLFPLALGLPLFFVSFPFLFLRLKYDGNRSRHVNIEELPVLRHAIAVLFKPGMDVGFRAVAVLDVGIERKNKRRGDRGRGLIARRSGHAGSVSSFRSLIMLPNDGLVRM